MEILSEYGLLGSKPSKIPLQKGINWRKDDTEILKEPATFRRRIGQLTDLPQYNQTRQYFQSNV